MREREPQEVDLPLVAERLRQLMGLHFSATGDFADWLVDVLVENGWENPFAFMVIDKPKALQALRRIDQALAELGRACFEASKDIPQAYGILYREVLTGGAAKGTSWLDVSLGQSHYRDAIRRAVQRIESDPKVVRSAAQLNARAIGLVDGCRLVWWYATGKPAPSRDLNPASKFAEFLGDVIQAFGLSGEPRPAFRAWVKHASSP